MTTVRGRILFGIAAILVGGSITAAAQTSGELRIDVVDAREFPTISVIVTPPPELFGVQPSEVVLLEDGVERPATVSLLTDAPLDVLLAIDTSGSMRGSPLDAAKQAAAAFVEAMPPTTRVAVMGFAAQPVFFSSFGDDPQDALAAIAALQATGETALYDAVAAAVEAFPTADNPRRFIVLLSDGGDTISSLSLEEAIAAVSAAGTSMYAVELTTEENDPESLEALAGTDRVVQAQDSSALTEVYGQIASELVNQLAVIYTTGVGGSVELEITIRDPRGTASGTGAVTLPAVAQPPPTTVTTSAGAGTVTTTRPAPEEPTPIDVTAATPTVGSGPGSLEGSWVLPVGTAVTAIALLILMGMALVPAEGRTSQLRRVRERFKPTGGLLSRVSSGIQSALDRALERPGRRGLTAALDGAGIRWSAGEFVIFTLTGMLVAIAVGLALFGLIGVLVFGTLALLAPFLLLAHRREKRRAGFEEQMEGALQLMSGSLRAGYGLIQAISTVAAEAPSPIQDEFARIMIEVRVGRDLGEALAAMADRMKNEDFRWVAQAIEIQRTVGGDLSEILDTVAGTIRERNQIRRQVRSLSAEGRISAYVLISLPFFISTFLILVAPDFLTPLFDTVAGRVALGVAIVLLLIGIVWIRRMVKIKF